MVSTLLYHPKSVWKTLQSKAHFSLAFYAEKLKKQKIPFLVTKRGQKLILISNSDPRPPSCVQFHLLLSLQSDRIIPVEGGGKNDRFPPPPDLKCTFRRVCSGGVPYYLMIFSGKRMFVDFFTKVAYFLTKKFKNFIFV